MIRFRMRLCVLLLLLLLLLLPAFAFTEAPCALPENVSTDPCVEGVCKYHLPNGLRVLLFPDTTKLTVTVNIVYGVGSLHENYGETGMAHLLEHLLFKGTPTQADIPGEMKKRGVGYNATTGLDHTNYFASRGCVLRRASEPLTVTTNYSSRECWWMPTSLASVGD